MIHAFFNIRLDDAYLPERTGQMVEDAAEARAVARTIIRRLVVQHGGEPRLLNAVMAITDATGASILDLSFFEALYMPVAAPKRVAAERIGADLRSVAIRAPARVAAAVGAFVARMGAMPQHPRFAAARAQGRAALASVADGLSFRRDPRQRFRLHLEAGH